MEIAIRVDASISMGTGHVMRCLTLAEALRDGDAKVHFISREHDGNLIELTRSKGFKVSILPKGIYEKRIGDPGHASWLEELWERDAEQTQEALKDCEYDWLIVDHYALAKNWESRLRKCCKNLMVIDDLADREHDCDLLLDQSYKRDKFSYEGLVPPKSILLLGVKYVLLRSEFLSWRKVSNARRKEPSLENILIFFGGGSNEEILENFLNILFDKSLLNDVKLTVVTGTTIRKMTDIKRFVEGTSCQLEVLSRVDNMAELMARSDLAIGAAGGTTWERLFMGLPSVLTVTAENQIKGAKTLEKEGYIKTFNADNLKEGKRIIESLDEKTLFDLSRRGVQLVDGKGVSRVIKKIWERDEDK